jgi:Ca-activated chloride channel family protein
LILGIGTASADSYAALDEVPAGGGELRLIQPRADSLSPPAARPTSSTRDGSTSIGFPLQHTDVQIQVRGVMAEVVVEQTFTNPYPEALDAVYVFPLGPDAAVSGYEFQIGERVVHGEIEKRDEARRRFEEAREEGRTAGLLQQEKPNVFTQEIVNLPPGETLVVRFEYVELVDYYDGEYELVFPMVVGPRYLPGSSPELRPIASVPLGAPPRPGATTVSYLPPGRRSGHDIDVHISLDAGVPLTRFASTTHALVDGGSTGTEQRLGLDPSDTLPNKDLVLRWAAAGPTTVIGTLTHRVGGEDGGDGYLTLLIQPKAEYTTADLAPREVILLIDSSGSMSGTPMSHAREVARGLLDALRPADTFNVIAFSSQANAWAATPVAASPTDVADAQRFVSSLRGRGGTEMMSGLRAALSQPPAGERIRVIYLISDGQVGNDDEILALLGRRQGGLRVYPVGVGSSPNRYLFDRTAERARGFASYVGPHDSPDELVARLVERSTRPYLTDIEIDWGTLKVVDMTPAVLPDVHAGEPLAISARYLRAGRDTITVRANVAGTPVEVRLDLELPDSHDQPAVGHLWARRRIHEIRSESLGLPDAAGRRAITDLGLEFGLVTDYTSYVAVDETRTTDRTGVRRLVQAVPLPDGMRWNGVFGGGGGGTTVASNTPLPPSRIRSSSPSSPGHAPAPAAPAAPARTRRGGSFGGGGGGAIDPLGGLVLLGLAAAVRRRKDRSADRSE